jgi:tetratricopeptide (TPR) repeat protein
MRIAGGRFGFLINALKSVVIKPVVLSNGRIKFLLVFLILSSACQSCNYAQTKDQDKAKQLITTRTLGLAYLEEFKLEEAEKEFLKFIKLAPKEKLGYANLGLTYLRMGKYPEAERQLMKAIKIDPRDPDIRLILATVYRMNDSRDKAISELKEALKYSPGHVKTLYDISEIYALGNDKESQDQREFYTRKLVEYAPANVVPRLNLIDILIRKGDSDKAIEQMEILKKQYPEFAKEAADYYNKTMTSLRNPGRESPLNSFIVFHNYLKISSPYQAGIMDLKGPGGSLVGFPLISFDQENFQQSVDAKTVLNSIKFTIASSSAGLDMVKPDKPNISGGTKYITNVIVCDYDSDGDIDIYASWCDPKTSLSKHYLLNNELGRFKEISLKAGIRHTGKEYSASFADFDNDGFPDLYVLRDEGNILYRNTGKGVFENVTEKAKVADKTTDKATPNMSLFSDLDHDGDLDIFIGKTSSNKVYRNNSDGTFIEQASRMGFSTGNANSRDAAFGDFDEDGDIDLFVVNENSGNILYSNQRQGIFRDVTLQSGLKNEGGSTSVAAGDYDNDGYLDLFIASIKGGNSVLYTNLRNGTFRKEEKSKEIFRVLQNVMAYDASFLDFDNDGFLDLIIAGESTENAGKGIYLFHNDGKGSFTNVSNLLPSDIRSGCKISIMDYNDDGDLDIIIAGIDGSVNLLRNDGGNAGHFINMKLVGLRAGSAKNNYFGIGAKVELRSGDLYQTTVVTDPDIHFGIGNRPRADVIRITWTNGVPQNIFYPGTDQSLIENQILKGSCPFLYTWNGSEYVFVKDIMWRSALGMPLGIMGGTTAYAFPDASDDFLKIPGELLKPKDGKYSLQVTAELWETIYFDKVELVAVDHPDSTDVFVDEKFSGPPFPGLKIYTVGEKHLPVTATDRAGNDVLQYIARKDDKFLSDFQSDKYQGITEMRDLILDPGKFDKSKGFFLFLQGWIFPTDASINVALSQSPDLKASPPSVQVIGTNGEWVTVIDNLGFPMGKDKTVIADLSGKFLSGDHRIRIRTNMEIYWDQIFWSECRNDVPVILNTLDPVKADIHYRGFSGMSRKGGRYGPHWFDYSVVDTTWKWRDLTGDYTRYGDVLPLLTESDNKYIITNAGDETSIDFNPGDLPELKKGWKRDFLIRSVGWVKDGDLNTAFGNTVLPLPFHGMKSYPPGINDIYPDDSDHQSYRKQYNTRRVSSDGYLKAFRDRNLSTR